MKLCICKESGRKSCPIIGNREKLAIMIMIMIMIPGAEQIQGLHCISIVYKSGPVLAILPN
jgi:hypothetical protein